MAEVTTAQLNAIIMQEIIDGTIDKIEQLRSEHGAERVDAPGPSAILDDILSDLRREGRPT